jgi:YesN/AraC family two-component response regulator
LIPPGTLTYGAHNPQNRLFVYAVHFSTDGAPLKFDSKRISNISFFKELFSRVILFYNMNRKALVHSYLEVLLNEFFASPDAQKGKQTPESATHQKCVGEICDRINGAPEAKHSLSALAAEYGYSPTYLGKLFHKSIGISFSNYLTNARINHAKILLLNSKLSVGEIAEKLGYYDAGHFINQFKKTVGCTPNAYR